MRKLTVKNFSVIEDAKLEFGKITVLIGPQSSGKSLLCKLAYFLGKEIVDLAVSSILKGNSWDEYLLSATKEFIGRFTENGLVSQGTKLIFSSHNYETLLVFGDGPNFPAFQFSPSFKRQYELLLNDLRQTVPSASGAFIPGGLSSFLRQEHIWIELNQVLSDSVLDGVLYIPAGRALFTNTSKTVAILQNVGIDSITRGFAGQIRWDSDWKVGLLTTGRGVTAQINRCMNEISQGGVVMDSGVPRFQAFDGRKLPLELLSTGTQEMIPLFNILERLMYSREHGVETARAAYDPPRPEILASSRPFLYLEEPEANIFPKTQYDLVKLFAWLANDEILDFSWVITTHSPYILSSFNNLLQAWQVGAESSDATKAEVTKLIDERYWINPKDFRAYSIHDGKLAPIMDEETGLIDGSYLDAVSGEIGAQFDELLRIGDAKA
jgi:energy-coupling factor transporter ATP-binding protein EcfA2